MKPAIPLHSETGTLPRSNVRYRVIKWPTLADQLDHFYRKRQMVYGSRNEDDARE